MLMRRFAPPQLGTGPFAYRKRTGLVVSAGMVMPGLPAPGESGRLGQEDRNLPGRALLVFRVGRKGLDRDIP